MPALLPLLAALIGAVATSLTGVRNPRRAPSIALAASILTAAVAIWGVAAGGGALQVDWIATWGATIALELDALAALFLVLTAAIGVLTVAYSLEYIPEHLEKKGRDVSEQTRFFALILLFLASMVGLVLARDLILLFLFFDLTAITSYFLIAYDRENEKARRAALMALVVTVVTSIGFLIAAVMFRTAGASFDLAELRVAPLDGPIREWGAVLIVVAALAKSAQVPFHFWLPRAMAAPTPVSAYLHSAAMVAAGVFLLLRLEPLLDGTLIASALPALGLASILVGSLLALAADELKPLLAYSTIAQYGYVVLLIGIGGDAGLAGAAVYVLAHAIAKSALFFSAGAVTRTMQAEKLSALGGLRHLYPGLALVTGIAAAALAGLPLTVGYFKDEALFEAALEWGAPAAVALALGVALTIGYTARFWFGIFWGEEATAKRLAVAAEAPDRVPAGLFWPIAALALAALAGALAPGVLAEIGSAAGAASARRAIELELEYGITAKTALALGAYGAGALIYVGRAAWMPAVRGLERRSAHWGPEALYERALDLANAISDRLHDLEVRDLRDRLAAILLPAGALVAIGLAFGRRTGWEIGPVGGGQIPILAGVITASVAAVLATVKRTHLTLVIALTVVGFTLAAIYSLLGAAEVALVAVLVETTLTLLILTALGLLPRRVLRDAERHGETPVRQRRHWVAGAVAGVAAFVVAWSILSWPSGASVAEQHEQLKMLVHAKDTVSAVLTDFRGLDTAGEATVLVIALLGLRTLLRREEH